VPAAVIDLRSLEVFFWVVKLGGFGRAAERLHMTQPAVSARISQIESRFGVRLLERAPNRAAAPTPKGMELYACAERMLALRSEVEARLSGGARQTEIVRIGIAETLVHTLLGKLIRRLHDLFPGITPEVTVDISPNLQAMLLKGEADVTLLLGPVSDPRVRNVLLCDHEMAWVASPSLALPDGSLGLPDLARWPILSYARGTLPHAQLEALFCRPELPTVRIFASSSLASIISMALDGIGIGVVPHTVAQAELRAGRLRLLRTEHALPPLRFTASVMATSASGLPSAIADLAAQVAAGS
jgi:DNA-binding transcriptional LysR family regulator